MTDFRKYINLVEFYQSDEDDEGGLPDGEGHGYGFGWKEVSQDRFESIFADLSYNYYFSYTESDMHIRHFIYYRGGPMVFARASVVIDSEAVITDEEGENPRTINDLTLIPTTNALIEEAGIIWVAVVKGDFTNEVNSLAHMLMPFYREKCSEYLENEWEEEHGYGHVPLKQ